MKSRRHLITWASLALAGAVVVPSTAGAAVPTGMDNLTPVVYYDFGTAKDTNGTSWQTASQVVDGSSVPLVDYMRPGASSGTPTLQSAASGNAIKLNNAGRMYALRPSSGTNYANVEAYGFVATIEAEFGTTNESDSINAFQRGTFSPGSGDTNGQYKLQLKSNDDYPQCRFEDNKGDGGAAADWLLLSAPNTLDIVDGNVWTVSCWRDDNDTTANYSDDVFGITAVDSSGVEYETTATNGQADVSGTIDFGENSGMNEGPIGTSGDAYVGSLNNLANSDAGDLNIGGKADAVDTDTWDQGEIYSFGLEVNRDDVPVGPGEPDPHPLDDNNASGWGAYIANWQMAKAGSDSNGAGCDAKQVKDGAADPHKLDLCGDVAFRSSPTAVLFEDASYAQVDSIATFNPGGVDWRMQAKFNPTALPSSGNSAVIAQKGSSGDRWRMLLNSDGSVTCNFNEGTLNAQATSAASSVSAGSSVTANCIIWNGDIYTYVGAASAGPDATDEASGWSTISNSEAVRVARRDATLTASQTHQFLGKIDFLRIWKGHSA